MFPITRQPPHLNESFRLASEPFNRFIEKIRFKRMIRSGIRHRFRVLVMVEYPIVYLLFTYKWDIDHASLIHNTKNAPVCTAAVSPVRHISTSPPSWAATSFTAVVRILGRLRRVCSQNRLLGAKKIKRTIFSQVTRSGDHGGITERGNSRRWFGGLSRSQSECVLQMRPLYRSLSLTHAVDRDSQAAENSNWGRGRQCGLLTVANC